MMQSQTFYILLTFTLVFSQNNRSQVAYPNFSNLVSQPTPSAIPTPTPTPTPNPIPTPAPTPTPTQSTNASCSLYDSKINVEYDVLQGCQSEANSKSPVGLIACELLEDVKDLLKSCIDKNGFEQGFVELATAKMSSFSSPDGWLVWGIGIPFEPYTFKGVQLYYPYLHNSEVAESDELEDLIDSYNFYTDCESGFGDACTFYHQAKLATYYEEKGGAWLVEIERQLDDVFVIFESFFVPIIIDGRFFGLLEAEVIHQ